MFGGLFRLTKLDIKKTSLVLFMSYLIIFLPACSAQSIKNTNVNTDKEVKASIAYCRTPLHYKDEYRYFAFANLTSLDQVELTVVEGNVIRLENLASPSKKSQGTDRGKVGKFFGDEIEFHKSGIILLGNERGGPLKLATEQNGVYIAPTDKCGKFATYLASTHQNILHESLEDKYNPFDKLVGFREGLYDIYTELKQKYELSDAKGSSSPSLITGNILEKRARSYEKPKYPFVHVTDINNIPEILERGGILPPEETGYKSHGSEGTKVVFATYGDSGMVNMLQQLDHPAKIYIKPTALPRFDLTSRFYMGNKFIGVLIDPEVREKVGLPEIDTKLRAIGHSTLAKAQIPTALEGESKAQLRKDLIRYIKDQDFQETVNRVISQRKENFYPFDKVYTEILEAVTTRIPNKEIFKIGVKTKGQKRALIEDLKNREINFQREFGKPVDEFVETVDYAESYDPNEIEKVFKQSGQIAKDYYRDSRIVGNLETVIKYLREVEEGKENIDQLIENSNPEQFKPKIKRVMGKEQDKAKENMFQDIIDIIEGKNNEMIKLESEAGVEYLEFPTPSELGDLIEQRRNMPLSQKYGLLVSRIRGKMRNNLIRTEMKVSSRLLDILVRNKHLLKKSQRSLIQKKWSGLTKATSSIKQAMKKDLVSKKLLKTLNRARNSKMYGKINSILYHLEATSRVLKRSYLSIKNQFSLSNIKAAAPYAIFFAIGQLTARTGRKQEDPPKILLGHGLRLLGLYYMSKAALEVGWTTYVAYASYGSIYAAGTAFVGSLTSVLSGFLLFFAMTVAVMIIASLMCLLSFNEHLPWCMAHRFTPARRLTIPNREEFFLSDVPLVANYVRGSTIPIRFSFRQELDQGKLRESRQVGTATCQVMDTGEGKICLGEFGEDLRSILPAGSRVRGHYKVTKVPDWFENAVYNLARGKEVTIGQKVDRNYYLFGRGQDFCVQTVEGGSHLPIKQYEEYCHPVGRKIEEKLFLNSRLPYTRLEPKDEGLVCYESRRPKTKSEETQIEQVRRGKTACASLDQIPPGEYKKEFETMAAEMPPRSVNQGLSASLQLETTKGSLVSKTFDLTTTKTLDESDFYRLAFKSPYRSDETSGWFGRDHATGLDFTVKNKAPKISLQAVEMTVKAVDYPEGRCGDDHKVSMSYKPELEPGNIFKFGYNDFCDASDKQELQFEIELSSLRMERTYCVQCEQDGQPCQMPVRGDCGQG